MKAEEVIDPEEGASEQAANDATTQNIVKQHPKRRRRRIIVIAVIVVVVLIAITLAAVLTTDDNDEEGAAPNREYLNMLTQMNVTASSSDTEVEQAILALTDYFLATSTCSAGISVGIIRNGTRTTVSQGVLNSDEPNRPVDQDTLFEIGSVSKPVTGLVLAHEIANSNNNLTLDTPINSLLPDSVPDLVVKGELVTFRQLVTHTAGFPRLPKVIRESDYNSYYDPNPYAGYSETDMLRELSIAASELSQTGDYEYSNFGFSTLAYLLATSRNTSFPLLQRERLQRLGLDDTWIELPEEARQNLSTGYRVQEQAPYWFDGGLFINGGGSTLSSARDLLTLVEVLMSPEEKLQDSHLIEALELSLSSLYEYPFTDNAGVAFAWNYGGTPRFYSHGGATAGFVTYVAFQPATRTGAITLSNCGDNYDSSTLGDALALKLFLLQESDS